MESSTKKGVSLLPVYLFGFVFFLVLLVLLHAHGTSAFGPQGRNRVCCNDLGAENSAGARNASSLTQGTGLRSEAVCTAGTQWTQRTRTEPGRRRAPQRGYTDGRRRAPQRCYTNGGRDTRQRGYSNVCTGCTAAPVPKRQRAGTTKQDDARDG